MKICFIADGGSIHTQRWINFFAQAGHNVHLISNRFLIPNKSSTEFDKRITCHKLMGMIEPVRYARYPIATFWILQTWAIIRSIKPDIVDAHNITGYGYVGVASRFHPLVLTAWGSDILINPKKNPIVKILTPASLKAADRVVCDSQILKTEIMKMGISSEKISIIQFGVDTQKFSPAQRDNERSSPIIICIRSLEPVYNVSTVIKTIPLVLAQVPQAQFIIAGDGTQREYLIKMAESLKVSASVHFVGQLPHHEVPALLTSSDVYVSTSLSDSSSLSLQEAMACGLPTVVSDLPANREWVKDGESGYIRPARDVQGIAECIITLLNSPSQRREFGKLGRAKIVSEADHIVNLQKAERLYLELIG